MALPALPDDPKDPSDWAERVPRDEPDILALLDAHVRAYATQADELAKTSREQVFWGLTGFVTLFLAIGGFAAVFGNPDHIRRGWVSDPDAADIPWAMLSYGVAALGLLLLFVGWWRLGRVRMGGFVMVAICAVVFGALGIPVAAGLVAEEGRSLGWEMLPCYVMMGLAVILIVVNQCSPKPPPAPEPQTVEIDDLGEKAMRYLTRERDEALKILWRRELITREQRDALRAQPPGRAR